MLELLGTLPDAKVTMTWGSPHFRVSDKIFSGWGADKDGRYSMSAKLDKDKQAALVASDPRFQVAAYVGKHGWVSFTPGDKPDLGEIEALLLESYRNVATKAQVAKLDGEAQPARKAAAKPAMKQPAAKAKAAKATKTTPTAKATKTTPAAKTTPTAKATKTTPAAKTRPTAKATKARSAAKAKPAGDKAKRAIRAAAKKKQPAPKRRG
jgi:predicted DNA-binding protein (MmcQ/YjbR family)